MADDHRAAQPRRSRSRPGHGPGGLGARQRQQLPAPAPTAHRPARRPDGQPVRVERDAQGRRAGGRAAARLDVRACPRPVRPARASTTPPRPPPTTRTSCTTSGPNVLALEKRFAFPPQGVPPVAGAARGHPPGAVHRRALAAGALPRARSSETLDSVDPDPKRFLDALTKVVDDLRQGRKPLDDGGLAVAPRLARPSEWCWTRSAGLMSLLEGHGDVTMDRAGADRIPSSHRFARVLRERRANANPAAKVVAAAPRHRGQDQPVRPGRVVHRRGRTTRRRTRRPRSRVARRELARRRSRRSASPSEWLDRVRLSDELVG